MAFCNLCKYRSTLILLFTPILLLPVILLSPPELQTAFSCAYTILLMAVYWVAEVLPLAVTALLPLVLYPMLGVLPAGKVSMQYLKDVNILFLGGLTVAVAVEYWNLHKRIALKVLTKVGAKPKWLLFGFMTTTAFLSMWISNVATTAMMIPIAQAVLDELYREQLEERSESRSPESRMEILTDDESISTDAHLSRDSHLAIELGNIGDAQALGARLASSESNEVGQGEFVNEPSGGYYSFPTHPYNSLATDESVYFQKEKEEVEITVTKPDTPTPPHSPKLDHSNQHLGVGRNRKDSSSETNCSSRDRLISLTSDNSVIIDFAAKIDRANEKKGMAKALTICVCYSSNIGGTATLTGTGPNLILAGQFKTTYPQAPEVDFGSWVFFALPGMLVFLFLTWIWLQYLFLNLKWRELIPSFRRSKHHPVDEQKAEFIIKQQYRELGPMSFAEKSVLFFFILLAFLWLSRDPGFVAGWGSLSIFKPRYVTDATVAMLITFALFIWPSRKPNILCFKNKDKNQRQSTPRIPGASKDTLPPLLTWKIVQEKMAWNVILLLGGGFAMALGAKESGLSRWIGLQLTPLNALSPFAANLICCLVICALTQCTSNTATATVFIPILAELAEVLQVNPLFLTLPATIVTSYAFMLPVSTPPNAIAYSYNHLKMKDMIKAGFLLNIVGIFIALSSIYLFGGPAFDVFENCPGWLHSEQCNNVLNATTAASTLIHNITLTTFTN